MKLILEIVLALLLHPIAFLLMLIDLFKRGDIPEGRKIVWAFVGVFWGLGPILYLLVGEGELW